MQPQTDNLFTLEQVKCDIHHNYVLAETVSGAPMYRKVMTDGEIDQAALEDWLRILAQLWTAFGKLLDDAQLTVYQEHLAVLPLGLLETAVKRVIRDHRFNSVPTIAQVWAAVRVELGNPPDLDREILLWVERKWTAAVFDFGVARSVAAETEV